MIFSLPTSFSPTPIPSLRGATSRCKPLIPIEVIGPTGQVKCSVLVDTGADDVVFSHGLAAQIGIDLRAVPRRHARGVGGTGPVNLFYAPVILLLQDQQEAYRWRATAAFMQAFLRFPLLGIAGGLEFFRTTLDVEARQVELIAKSALPTTQDPAP